MAFNVDGAVENYGRTKKKAREYLDDSISDDETNVNNWIRGGMGAGMAAGIAKAEMNPKKALMDLINSHPRPDMAHAALKHLRTQGPKSRLLVRALPAINKASKFGLIGGGVGLGAGVLKKAFSDDGRKIEAKKKIREYLE